MDPLQAHAIEKNSSLPNKSPALAGSSGRREQIRPR